MLENGSYLHVNEHHKILLKKEEERRRMPNRDILTSRDAYVNCAIIAMLYTRSIGNQL